VFPLYGFAAARAAGRSGVLPIVRRAQIFGAVGLRFYAFG